MHVYMPGGGSILCAREISGVGVIPSIPKIMKIKDLGAKPIKK